MVDLRAKPYNLCDDDMKIGGSVEPPILPNGTFFDTVGLMHLERGIISECNHPK